jgi:hypothetical protein
MEKKEAGVDDVMMPVLNPTLLQKTCGSSVFASVFSQPRRVRTTLVENNHYPTPYHCKK